MSDIEQCWSKDNEDFSFTAVADLLDCYDELKTGDTVYVGKAKKPKPSRFFDVESLLEQIANDAYDLCGEHAEDFPDLTKEDKDELNKLVSTWLDAKCEVRFYEVSDTREYILSEADFT